MAWRPPETIETDRAVLCRHRPDTIAALVAAVNESVDHLRPWMPWAARPATVETMTAFVSGAVADFDAGRSFSYVVLDPARRDVIGGCGLHTRRGRGVLEIGYWVHVGWTRRGVASSAAGALTDVAVTLPGVERVEIRCDATNAASAGVPRRLGYRLEGIVSRPPDAPAETGREMVWVKGPA